jgi:hypothetical protein
MSPALARTELTIIAKWRITKEEKEGANDVIGAEAIDGSYAKLYSVASPE